MSNKKLLTTVILILKLTLINAQIKIQLRRSSEGFVDHAASSDTCRARRPAFLTVKPTNPNLSILLVVSAITLADPRLTLAHFARFSSDATQLIPFLPGRRCGV